MTRPVLIALAAAALFGASTPFARALVGTIDPLWLAGLLYAGSGVGLALLLLFRRLLRGEAPALAIAAGDLPWLVAGIVCGGVIAPVLFTFGLRTTTGATASLLANLETVFTVALAWFAFREHRNTRVMTGMAAIVAACVILSWPKEGAMRETGAVLIALACLGWALDNNFTRRVAGNDATLIAALKGLAGGAVNLGLAVLFGGPAPPVAMALAAGTVGFFGYGVSLALFVLALRHLGTARASAYFATAPFVGAAISFALLAERPDLAFAIAAPLMALGVWLHFTERHEHVHTHEAMTHTHSHWHDEHHRHTHAEAWGGTEPHTHEHRHDPLTHAHPHAPDLHHRHSH